MTQNIDLLTVLFAVCYFIVKGRTDVVFSTLTRDVDGDYFTDVCGNCDKYGAVKTQRVCKCKSTLSVFLRNEGRCKDRNYFVNIEEKCLSLKNVVAVIDPEKEAKYSVLIIGKKYESCRVKPLISFRNSSTGTWHLFNLTGNEFIINMNTQPLPSIHMKVSQKSPNLTVFKGYVMKLRLNCTKYPILSSGNKTRTKDLCLLFKVKGEVQFPLACPSPVSSPATTGTPTKQSTTTGTTGMPSTTTTKPITTPDQMSLVTKPVGDTDEKDTSTNGSSSGSGVLIGVAVACAVVFAIILILLVVFCKRRKLSRRKRKKHTARLHVGNAFSNQGEEAIIPLPPSEGRRAVDEAVYAEIGSPSCEEYTLLKPAPDRCRSEYQSLIKPNEDHSGYLIPLEVTGSADCHPDGAILSELQSPKPPQDKAKDKTYDYAKPEGIIMLTASRSSLDSLDPHRQADVPSSQKNTTFQGPNSPRSPGVSLEEPSHDKEGDDSLQADDYIEVLPNSEIGSL